MSIPLCDSLTRSRKTWVIDEKEEKLHLIRHMFEMEILEVKHERLIVDDKVRWSNHSL